MSADDHSRMGAEQLRAQDAVRELSRPAARPAFERALREEFVRPGHAPARRRWAPRPWQLVAAAAALLFLVLNRPVGWEVAGSEGIQQVLVDGAPVALAELPAQLRPGRVIRLPGPGRLDLVADQTLYLQLEDQIELTLPRNPARWLGRSVDARVSGDGRLRVMTGDAFRGAKLTMHAGFADWEVTGTCFTVIAHDDVVCLCVLEGTVRACPAGGEMAPVPSGQRATFVAGGQAADRGRMREDERAALTALMERADELLTP